jgi:hypothetical protein
MNDLKIYDGFVEYCYAVGHVPPTFEKWLSIRDTPIEFEKADKPVVPSTTRAGAAPRAYTQNNQITAANLYFPYERWESVW